MKKLMVDSFGGDSKGGRITGKGKISTGKLDLEDVYFVKELKFNLFSVSQIRDKKNSVLFTDTKCVVLSPDFKLLNKNHVLLKVPRKDNMYSVDLKNIVPLGGLTYLFANATLDESNIWHRRLGHINFKTLNKLARGNLFRGTKENIGTSLDGKKTVPDQKYILLPLVTSDPLLSKNSKDSPDAGFKPSGEEEKIDSEHQENKDSEFPDKVYKVEKALYGLHQAPKAWYETLSTYLLANGFRRGTIDKTLFIKKDKDAAQRDSNISSASSLSSVGLQLKQKYKGIFISPDQYRDVLMLQIAVGAGGLDPKSNLDKDKTIYKELEDRMKRAATTASSLEADLGHRKHK
ncbi:ribonuclease H-like domain-containing protein [Tanacetum coccineum]